MKTCFRSGTEKEAYICSVCPCKEICYMSLCHCTIALCSLCECEDKKDCIGKLRDLMGIK